MSNTIEKILAAELKDIVKDIKSNIDTSNRKATGKTQKNITSDTQDNKNMVSGQIYAPDYIENLETGTPPKKGYSFIDVNDLADDLADWSEAKGIKVDDLQSFVFRTAYTILEFGSTDFREKREVNIFSKELKIAQKELSNKLNTAYVDIFVKTLEAVQLTLNF